MRSKKTLDLIAFDVDGTLVKHPTGMVIWEVLNIRYGGSHEANEERYRMYHDGKLAYEDWVRLDVEGWIKASATRDDMLEAIREFDVVHGAHETLMELRNRGFKLAVISGTLDIVLDSLFPEHPFEEIYTNKVKFDRDGILTSWEATQFDISGKPDALREIANKHRIPLSRSAFVGDGENDVPLLDVAGFFVAYQPKCRELERRADRVISGEALTPLLDIFHR